MRKVPLPKPKPTAPAKSKPLPRESNWNNYGQHAIKPARAHRGRVVKGAV